MGSRLFAALIVVAGIALLGWAGLRDNTTTTATTAASPAAATATTTETTSVSGPADDDNPSGAAEPADSDIQEAAPASPTATPEPAPESTLENFGPRRQLLELDGWLNTDITSLDDLDGKVVLVEMWTFGCHNCKARIPYNQSFYETYDRDEFEIVGVHAPEFNYEADVANIEQALVDLGVTWPVALDTNKKNFRVWQEGTTNYWPRSYLIDQNGDIRFDHIGEGKYSQLEEAIESLLANPPAAAAAG